MSLSGKGRRDKGVRGEREVALAFEKARYQVRGLEAEGDHLVVCADWLTLHIEAKRQEKLRLPEWSRQAEAEAPQGTVPIVAYRASREPWRVSLKLDDFIEILPGKIDAKQFETMLSRQPKVDW